MTEAVVWPSRDGGRAWTRFVLVAAVVTLVVAGFVVPTRAAPRAIERSSGNPIDGPEMSIDGPGPAPAPIADSP